MLLWLWRPWLKFQGTSVRLKLHALQLRPSSLTVLMARHLKQALRRTSQMAKLKNLMVPNSTSELIKLSGELRSLQTERQKRDRAKNDLLTYASLINIPSGPLRDDNTEEVEEFKPRKHLFGAHHLLWLDCLQQVEDGKIKRLMGLMPPGSAKSIYTSVVFPTHFMGRFRSSSIIVASYGSELPRKFGRRARSIVQQPIYTRIFNTSLSEESKAADEWALANGSEWMAAGILTGITGNRADGVIWDDLIKGREQADSDVVRNKTWDAYVDDLLTRKKPRAFEIGITTRWHEDDVAGRILPENYNGESGLTQCRDGNEWYVVCLPAECERNDDILGRKLGDILWPEWFTKEMFAPFKRNPRTWSSLYQQRPAPDSGVLFKAEWLKTFEIDHETGMPQGFEKGDLNIYGASDYAVTAGRENYTVHIVVGVDFKNNIYLLDLWRKQETSDKWVEAFCDLVKKWKPLGWAEETGQINASVGPFLTKRMRERNAFVARAQFPSTKSKAMRAQSIIGRMAQNGLYCPFGADWFAEFRKELLLFDAGRYDDQVDALSLIGQVLDKMIPAEKSSTTTAIEKVFSTNPGQCTVTLDDMFEANEQRGSKTGVLRIH